MNIKNKIVSAVSRTVERMVRRSSVFRKTEIKLLQAQARASRIENENRELAERTAAIGRRLCKRDAQNTTEKEKHENSHQKPEKSPQAQRLGLP